MARTYRHSLSQGVRLAPVPWLIRLAVVYGINVLALIVVDWMFDSVTIGRWWSLLLGAFVLTIGNLIIKPILAILTLPLIIVTFGLAYFAINVLMLALAEWIAPDFSIDGFWTYVGATIVVWLVNVAVGWLLDKVTGD
jgi:putative membrane protein